MPARVYSRSSKSECPLEPEPEMTLGARVTYQFELTASVACKQSNKGSLMLNFSGKLISQFRNFWPNTTDSAE